MRGLKIQLLSNALRPALRRHSSSSSVVANFDLDGVFVPIPTPYRANGDVDYGALAYNFERWEKIPFRGDDGSIIMETFK